MENETYERILNIPNLKVDNLEFSDKTIYIYCHLDTKTSTCISCLKEISNFKSYHTYSVRDLDISGREVYLVTELKQFYCQTCDRYFTQSIPFVDVNKNHTHRQSKWIFEMSRKQPLSEVAALTNTHHKTVERIIYNHALPKTNDRYEHVIRLGVDEFSWRKGKKDYLCILTNLDTGETVDILRTRNKEQLIAHFKAINCSKMGWTSVLKFK